MHKIYFARPLMAFGPLLTTLATPRSRRSWLIGEYARHEYMSKLPDQAQFDVFVLTKEQHHLETQSCKECVNVIGKALNVKQPELRSSKVLN